MNNFNCTLIAIEPDECPFTVGITHLRTLLLTDDGVGVAEMNIISAGKVSIITTLVAYPEPWLV